MGGELEASSARSSREQSHTDLLAVWVTVDGHDHVFLVPCRGLSLYPKVEHAGSIAIFIAAPNWVDKRVQIDSDSGVVPLQVSKGACCG